MGDFKKVQRGQQALATYGQAIQWKTHILDAFENRMNVSELWRQGESLLDLGCGPGWLSGYLMGKYGLRVVAYEVPLTSDCKSFLLSPFRVNFFIGTVPEQPRSFTAVSIMNVLHHAGKHTPSLLAQAAQIARRWILITEDLDTGKNRPQLYQHDPMGIFRTHEEWQRMFAAHCEGFELRRWGRPRHKKLHNRTYYVGVEDKEMRNYAWYVLERRENS